MQNESEPEERIAGFLLTFIDFLYAVLFGFVLQQVYIDVILSGDMSISDKTTRVSLTTGVFYLLMTDWIQARLLISRNRFRGYRRFFIEVIIAFVGFGAAVQVIRADPFFLVYIGIALFLGSYWAHITLLEYPHSEDLRELEVIRFLQPLIAVFGGVTSYLWTNYVGTIISLRGAILLLFLGFVYEFLYGLFVPMQPGLASGPGVPFIKHETVDKVRTFLRGKQQS